MGNATHIPKIVSGLDGKPRVVYTRTPETDQEMEKFRLGPLADIKPLNRSCASELIHRIREKALVIQTPYMLARQAIRTRLEVDRSSHRVMNGVTLFGHYYFATDGYREGFPQFKQFYLMFGYIELSNKLLHQIVCETLFTRYELGLHFWLMIPKSLGEMAAQWGDSFLNLQAFQSVRISPIEDSAFSPLSTACPTAPVDTTQKTYRKKVVTDPSFVEGESSGDFGFGELTKGDVMFQPKKKRGVF